MPGNFDKFQDTWTSNNQDSLNSNLLNSAGKLKIRPPVEGAVYAKPVLLCQLWEAVHTSKHWIFVPASSICQHFHKHFIVLSVKQKGRKPGNIRIKSVSFTEGFSRYLKFWLNSGHSVILMVQASGSFSLPCVALIDCESQTSRPPPEGKHLLQ